MRLKFLTLLLVIVLTACSFQVEVIESPTPVTTVPPAEASTSTPLPTPDDSPTSSLLPTIQFTNTSVPASGVNSGGGPVPIQFGPNGTYIDIIESIKAEGSKTYSISAMQGQVMSVSFHQNDESEWTEITMQIIGADRSVLCSSDCSFWRGVLPATQTYFVTVSVAANAVDFVMRVAINPPGAATQSFLYENKYRNASLSYTDMFAPAFFPGAIAYRVEPELALQFIDTDSYAHTNLVEAYLLFGSSTDPQTVAACTQPASTDGPETVLGEVTINSVPFTKSEFTGVGAGNIYEQTYYRAAQAGTCFEITYFIHYGNISNYDPAAVTEFDHDALLQKFDQVLSTFMLQ